MTHYLTLALAALRLQFVTWKQYRVDYTAGVLTVLLDQALTLALFAVIFMQVPQVHGWTFPEMLMLYGFNRIALGLADTLGESLWWVGSYAQDGSLLLYKLRPLGVLFQLLTERIHFERISGCLTGLILLLHGASAAGLEWTAEKVVIVFLFVLLGALVFLGLMILGAAISMQVIGSLDAITTLWSITEFAKYPLPIFGRTGAFLLTFIVPLAVTGYLPATLLFNEPTHPLGAFALVEALIAAGAFFALCLLAWSWAIQAYEGTGN
ncbi:MAG: ABC-2 family transporter protein [Meiothermus sp.]|nr:ABC-2 family transporter protein [Candidatus Binatia bacterium]MCX7601185.1 ABC-2 family transporter protein [Meiothermus sp.]